MPVFRITAPDGTRYRVDAPEGATEDEALARIQSEHTATDEQVAKDRQKLDQQRQKSGTALALEGKSGLDRALIGSGQAFMGLGRGAAQLTGLARFAPVRRALSMNDETEAVDKELLKDPAAIAGNIGTQLATTLPFAWMKAANTVKGAAAVGAGMGALQPTQDADGSVVEGAKDRIVNTALGAAFGAGGQALGNKIGETLSRRFIEKEGARVASLAAAKPNAETLKQAHEAGYVWPRGGLLNALGGKQATAQKMSQQNIKTLAANLADELGLPPNTAITDDALKAVRSEAWEQGYKPLEEVDAINWSPKFESKIDDVAERLGMRSSKLESLKHPEVLKLADELKGMKSLKGGEAKLYLQQLREQGHLNKGASEIAKRRLGAAQIEASEAIEDLITENLEAAGKQDVIPGLRSARERIAKSFDIEKALVEGTGEVDPKKLKALLERGKHLSGHLATAAKFTQAQPDAMRLAGSTNPGNTMLGLGLRGLMGYEGYQAMGPEGAALFLAPSAARRLNMSRVIQKAPKDVGPIVARTPIPAEQRARLARLLAFSGTPYGALEED